MDHRFDEYVDARIAAKQPVEGSKTLFRKVWRSFKDIVEVKATKHPLCEICAKFETKRAKYDHDWVNPPPQPPPLKPNSPTSCRNSPRTYVSQLAYVSQFEYVSQLAYGHRATGAAD